MFDSSMWSDSSSFVDLDDGFEIVKVKVLKEEASYWKGSSSLDSSWFLDLEVFEEEASEEDAS